MQDTRVITAYRQSLKERILDAAMQQFSQQGVKTVKMDDIAQILGISKRTLYEIYENKEQLLLAGLKKYKQEKDQEMRQHEKSCNDVMDFILQFYRMKVDKLRAINPKFFSDISKYPKVLAYLNEDSEDHRRLFFDVMRRGVSEGFFRNDINYELVNDMFDAMSTYMASNGLYHKYSLEELYHNSVLVSLRGLCTLKGVEALDRSFSLGGTVPPVE